VEQKLGQEVIKVAQFDKAAIRAQALHLGWLQAFQVQGGPLSETAQFREVPERHLDL
jgi:hypothetical protein